MLPVVLLNLIFFSKKSENYRICSVGDGLAISAVVVQMSLRWQWHHKKKKCEFVIYREDMFWHGISRYIWLSSCIQKWWKWLKFPSPILRSELEPHCLNIGCASSGLGSISFSKETGPASLVLLYAKPSLFCQVLNSRKIKLFHKNLDRALASGPGSMSSWVVPSTLCPAGRIFILHSKRWGEEE